MSCPSGKRALPLCKRRLSEKSEKRGGGKKKRERERKVIWIGTFAAPFVLAHDIDGIRKWLEYISAVVPAVQLKSEIILGAEPAHTTFCSSLLLL